MIVHTEDRPFRCDTCGKRFKAKEYLKQHAKSHNKTRRSQYCPICNIEYFVSDDTLRYHIEQDHPGIPWPQSAIRTEEIPGVGRVSCVTHTFTTPTGVVTASSMISSPFGNVVYTQTTSTATRTSTRTSTSTSTGTSTSTSTSTTTTQAHYPLETATIGQSSDSFSLPANPISDDLDLYKILDEKDKDFAQWRFDPNASD
ncbi:C2H2-type zinc finger protein [Candidatus Sororendozoicomonas aggregata]|uniref:C2H2-type zinc finger protein n=1 Tax=Candidatus Sororendozoicomonas aggregata TaxID=3073239 RepID=UPI002ED0BAAF